MTTLDLPERQGESVGAGKGSVKRAKSRRGGSQGSRVAPILFLTPFMILFAIFFLLPIGYAIYQSLFHTEVSGLGLGPNSTVTKFVGLSNFSSVLSDHSFFSGLGRVVLFGIVQVPTMLLLATVLALLLDSASTRLKRFFRLSFFLPYGVPGVIAAILWSFLYLPGLSPIVSVLKSVGFGNVNFLGIHSVLWSIANIITWEYTGYNMLIIYAGLQAIPQSLFEAARIDGASELMVALRIKLPLIFSSIVLTAVFSIIGTLQLFSEPQVLRAVTTNISSSFTPNLLAYTKAFVENDPNMAAAVAVILALGTFILSFGFLKIVQRRAFSEVEL
ncbi:MAG: sugar ABC transporter permease [Actinomycetota bacterium]|nr:sugar ABC transporter permease [Actinomycetota bacterium]